MARGSFLTAGFSVSVFCRLGIIYCAGISKKRFPLKLPNITDNLSETRGLVSKSMVFGDCNRGSLSGT